MGPSGFSKRFERMARNPSSCAPRPGELLSDETWGLPPWDSSLEVCSARDAVVENGRVVSLSLSGRAFVSSAHDLFQEHPIRSLRLVAVAPFLTEVANCERLSGLTRLDLFGNRIGPEGLKQLLASPFLANLRELGLGRNGLGTPGIGELLNWRGREKIRRLDLQGNGLLADDVHRLFGSSKWPELSGLVLSENALGPKSVESLFQLPLAELEIEGIELGTSGAVHLAESGLKPINLNLGFNRIGDKGIAELVRSELLAKCTVLDLRGNLIRSADPFVDSPMLRNVRSLDLRANPFDDDAVSKLRRRFGEAVLLS